MADVFISYCRADQPTAEALAQDLKASGLTVWWDAALQAGARFHKEIHGELQSARHVIVLWSEQTRASQYVEAEAEEARILGKLIPARLDGSTLPMVIRNTLHIADLRDWEMGLESILRTLGVEVGHHSEAPRSFIANDAPDESTDEGRIWRELLKAKLVLLRHYESLGAACPAPPIRYRS